MAYIGRPLNAGNLSVDVFTGNASTTVFTLTYSVGSSNSIGVYLDGVRQLAGTDFTASGTALTFTTAPANLVGIDVYFLGLELSIPTPADATVTAAKLASDAVTTAKILNNAVDETKLKDALIGDFTEVTVQASDSFLLGDADGTTKRDTIQGVLDLVPASGADTSLSNLSATGKSQVCQAWMQMNGSGTPAIVDSYNVASITDIATGIFQTNFDTALTNANYSFTGSVGEHGASLLTGVEATPYGHTDVHTVSAHKFGVRVSNGVKVDNAHINVQYFGD